MDPILSKAFLVLFVGMFTVFVILSLVVLSGKALISVINRYFPLPPEKVKKVRKRPPVQIIKTANTKKLAAIVAAVEEVTNGRGTITSIERV
ncbi:MAG: OadG family protein [Saprospiraceae bacterium]